MREKKDDTPHPYPNRRTRHLALVRNLHIGRFVPFNKYVLSGLAVLSAAQVNPTRDWSFVVRRSLLRRGSEFLERFVQLPIKDIDLLRHPGHCLEDRALPDSRRTGHNHSWSGARPQRLPHLGRGIDLRMQPGSGRGLCNQRWRVSGLACLDSGASNNENPSYMVVCRLGSPKPNLSAELD